MVELDRLVPHVAAVPEPGFEQSTLTALRMHACHSRPLGLRHLFAIGVMALALAGCGDDHGRAGAATGTSTEPTDDSGGGSADDTPEASALACVQESYPCSFEEVALPVIERSLELSREAAGQLRNGALIEDVAAHLSSESDIAELIVDGQVLAFRLVGGRQMIVDVNGEQEFLASATAAGSLASGSRAAAPQSANFASQVQGAPKPRTLRSAISPKLVSGGNKAQRRALVLSPFRYEGNFGNAGELIAAALDNVRGYAGNVTYLATSDGSAPQVTMDVLTQLHDYDVIHIDTHGGTLCKKKEAALTDAGKCAHGATDFLVQRFHGTAEDLKSIKHPGVIHYIGRVHESIAVTADFFHHYYPDGLADKLFILASCNTFRPDMADAIAGNTGVYVSWDGFTDQALVTSYGLALLDLLSPGLTIGEAFARLPTFTADNPEATGTLSRTQRKAGGDLRIRDLITVRDNLTGHVVTDLSGIEVMETPEDGQNDNLDLEFIVDGITPEQLENFDLNVVIDDRQLGYIDLKHSGVPVADFSYSVSTRVPLPFDVQQGQALRMDFWIPLPDQGQDHFIAAPKVNERELGREWVLNSKLLHDTTTITASVRFEVDPGDDPAGNFHYFYTKSGTVRVQRAIEGPDDCTYYVDHVVELGAGAPDNWLAFGVSGNHPVVSGFGSLPSQSVDASGCGKTLTVNVGGAYFVSGETIVMGDSVSGVYDNGAKIPTTIEWTLQKEL